MQKTPTLGETLRQTRLALGMTLDQLAERSGLSKGYLSLLENDKSRLGSLDKARSLAQALKMSLEMLGILSEHDAREDRPDWLGKLTERYSLDAPAQAALLSIAEESAVYRAIGSVARSSEEKDQQWDRFYHSVKEYLPGLARRKGVQTDSRMALLAEQVGISKTSLYSESDIVEGAKRYLQPFAVKAQGVLEFRKRLLKYYQVEVVWLKHVDQLAELKERCAAYGLFRAIGELPFFMEPDGIVAATYAVHRVGMPCKYLCIISNSTKENENRGDFSLWHELAHIIFDPLKSRDRATFRGDSELGSDKIFERMMDKIAAMMAFYDDFFDVALKGYVEVGARELTIDLVREIRDRFNPMASLQMTTKAVVDKWHVPLVYIEAYMRAKAGDPNNKSLRISHLHLNGRAENLNLGFGYNMRVPQGSIIWQLYSGVGVQECEMVDGMYSAIEDLSMWEFSDGKRLSEMEIRVLCEIQRESGSPRAHVFIEPMGL